MSIQFNRKEKGSTVGTGSYVFRHYGNSPSEFTGLCFTALSQNSKVQLKKSGTPGWTGSYSIDGITWIEYVPSITGEIALSNIGDKVYFKGDITSNFSTNDHLYFVMSGVITASGNCNSIYISSGFDSLVSLRYKYCYYSLFDNCFSLVTPPTLPATQLQSAEGCYLAMFSGCSSLATAPELPATLLSIGCYNNMFCGCQSLTSAPLLPASLMQKYCYLGMFKGCTKLTTAPALLSTSLGEGCYKYMFSGCTSLVTPPNLYAKRLYSDCYNGMFGGCTSLHVSDSPVAGATEQVWTMPVSGTFGNSYVQSGMFYNCAGTRSSDSMPGASGQSYTYYTQNIPIG